VARHASDLTTLVSQAKEEGGKQADLDREQKSFKALEEAIRAGKVRPGMTQSSIENRFGEPIVVLEEQKGRTAWLYQSPDWNWFAARKIYLEFDRNGKLRKWDIPAALKV